MGTSLRSILSNLFIQEVLHVGETAFESEMVSEMWNFRAEQKTFRLDGVDIGGNWVSDQYYFLAHSSTMAHKVAKDERGRTLDQEA